MDTNRRNLPLTATQSAVLTAARLLNDGWDRNTVVRVSRGALKPGPVTQAITVLRNRGHIREVRSTFTVSGWGFELVR